MKNQITLLILLFTFALNAQNRDHAFEVNKRLGRGINYGNMFEGASEYNWEKAWKPDYAKKIADLGFKHIRIPIRWEDAARSSTTEPYTINPDFLNRIKAVVDSVINNDLHAIINMHHHENLFENPEANKSRFLAQWKQISEFFKDYSDTLLFEILNEPHNNLLPDIWNVFLADAITTIREDNPDRVVVIGSAYYGGLVGLPYLQLPDDEDIIVTMHYYNPFNFTHQGASWVENSNPWLGTKWYDSETEREIIANEFAPLIAFEKTNKVPIYIGEFGAYSKADDVSRKKWTTFLARYFETLDWSWAYWEFSAGFGIYDANKDKYVDYLVDALLHDEMPEPAKYVGIPVYESNFTNSNDGWSLNRNSGASALLIRGDNSLKASISSAGTEGWHIQLARNNIKLTEGKQYRFSFKAKAETGRSATSYIGMNKDPWSAYGGYNGILLSDTFAVYTFVFDAQTSDNYARMVFDLGTSDSDFTITDIKLETITLEYPTASILINDYKTTIYPNPASGKIFVNNLEAFKSYSILNIQGETIQKQVLQNNLNEIIIEQLSAGIYFISLVGENIRQSSKIVIQ